MFLGGKMKAGEKFTITTSLSEDFGYSYNTDILTYVKEDSDYYYFLFRVIDFIQRKEIDKEVRVKKALILSVESAENFIVEENIPLVSLENCKKIRISNSKNNSMDGSFTNELLFLVAENKTHFQFVTAKKKYLVICKKNDRDIIELQEYVKDSENPFIKYPQLNDIWLTRQEMAISSIERFNKGDSSGKIYLIVLNGIVIGITGYYLTSNEKDAGLRWHGIIPSERKRGTAD